MHSTTKYIVVSFYNNINILEYQRICREFGLDNKTTWHVDDGISDGLCRVNSSKGPLGSEHMIVACFSMKQRMF